MTISRAEEAITEVIGYPKNVPGLVNFIWGDQGSDLLGGQKSCSWVSSDCTVVLNSHAYVSWYEQGYENPDGMCHTCGDPIIGSAIDSFVDRYRRECCLCNWDDVCSK